MQQPSIQSNIQHNVQSGMQSNTQSSAQSNMQSNTQSNLDSNSQPSNQQNTTYVGSSESPNVEQTSLTTYIFIGISVVVVFLSIYYAYNKFVENSACDTNSSPADQDKDSAIMDFNLRSTIQKLDVKQNKIIRKLSSDVGI